MLVGAALAALAVTTGCERAPTPSPAPPPPAPERAETASGPPVRHAKAFSLHTRLELPQVGTFARLSPNQTRALARLQAGSTLTTRVFASDGYTLVRPPDNHPAGGLLLVLDRGAGLLDVRLPEGRIVRLSAAALTDVLDRALPSQRQLGEDPMHGRLPQVERSTLLERRPLLEERWQVVAPLRYTRRDLSESWALRLKLVFEAPAAAARDQRSSTLCPLLYPHLFGADDLPAGLRLCPTGIRGWHLQLDNSDRESGASPRFSTAVERHGWRDLDADFLRFAGHVATAWRLPGPERPGAQLVAAKALAAMRAPGRRGTLAVDNRSGVAALVYLDGVLLGWVASGRQMSFSGLPRGFYNVYATAPSGVRSWGPRPLYTPGTMTLD